jgi:hypothetical protein
VVKKSVSAWLERVVVKSEFQHGWNVSVKKSSFFMAGMS